MDLFTGLKAIETLTSLQRRYRKLVLERHAFNTALNSDYNPWMYLDLQLAETLKKFPIEGNLDHDRLLVFDPVELKTIKLMMEKSSRPDVSGSAHIKNIFFQINSSEENRVLFKNALERLINSSSFFSKLLGNIVQSIVPLNEWSKLGSGVSYQSTKGAVFLGMSTGEFPELTLAINMAHETGHQALMLYQSCDYLIAEEDLGKACYSGVRKTVRPAINCLHASAALSYMIIASCDLHQISESDAESEFLSMSLKEYREGLQSTIESLIKACRFTPLGNLVIKDMLSLCR